MARFSQQEQNAMRRAAARRAYEMQQRVRPPGSRPASPYADYPPEPEPPLPKPPPPKPPPASKSFQIPFLDGKLNPSELLSKLDGDSMMILALMVMIYKDGGKEGCDRKLLMALAYLLT